MGKQSKIRFSLYILVISLLLMMSTAACSGGAGGKGVVKARDAAFDYIESVADETAEEPEMAESADEIQISNFHQLGAATGASSPSAQDPFGLIPADWPTDVRVHPHAKIAQSLPLASEGHFLLVLIPTARATIMGVQSFHIDELSSWESLEVEEAAGEKNENAAVLTIIAERGGAWLKITAEESHPGYLDSLENIEFWEGTVGPDPIIVRFYYAPVSPRL